MGGVWETQKERVASWSTKELELGVLNRGKLCNNAIIIKRGRSSGNKR